MLLVGMLLPLVFVHKNNILSGTKLMSSHMRIYGKILRFLKLDSSGQPTVKIW